VETARPRAAARRREGAPAPSIARYENCKRSNVFAFGSDESAGTGDDWPHAQKIVLKVADELSSGAEKYRFHVERNETSPIVLPDTSVKNDQRFFAALRMTFKRTAFPWYNPDDELGCD
jgi:hypothetical protein